MQQFSFSFQEMDGETALKTPKTHQRDTSGSGTILAFAAVITISVAISLLIFPGPEGITMKQWLLLGVGIMLGIAAVVVSTMKKRKQ